jgi:hypothetical protein
MNEKLVFSLLSLLVMTASSGGMKHQAYSAVKEFFQIAGQRLVFDGRYVDTLSKYGPTCRIVVDFSMPGEEYVAVSGEYTPVGTIGDGLYFDADESTFTQVEFKNESLMIEQKLQEGFSTWTKTRLTVSRHSKKLDVIVHQTSRLLLVPDTVTKRCVVLLD